jgi:hypothetical protein
MQSAEKVMVCVNEQTGEDRILSVTVGSRPIAPQESSPVPSERKVDIEAIDPAEQVRILERIQHAQVQENLHRAQALNGQHRLGRQVRTVLCRIRGKSIRMIVDTGASVSLLYLSQVKFCSAAHLIDQRVECRPELVGIGQHVSGVVGVIHALDVAVGPVKTIGAFAVVDKPGELGLLGIDWLNSVNATIRVADDSMEIHGHVIRFQDP